MAGTIIDAPAARLTDIEAIATTLALHSRGVDRNDHAMLCSAYHPDAQVAYGSYNGGAAEMACFLTDGMAGQPVTLHRTANMWIMPDEDGRRARSESYVIAYLRTPDGPDGTMIQRLIGGRYLDRHEKRDGHWAIAHRTYVLEWNANWPSSEAFGPAATALSAFLARGGQAAADPGRALLAYWAAGFGTASGGQDMTTGTAPDLNRLVARAALHDLQMAYCRAVDRADAALLASIFTDDATMNAGVFNGAASAFVPMIEGVVRGFRRSFHSVANEYYEVSGDDAVGESYVIAYVLAPGDDGDREMLTGGRYLDRYRRDDGRWKIAARVFVADWATDRPATSQEDGMYEQLPTRGGLWPDDPVYAFWRGAPPG